MTEHICEMTAIDSETWETTIGVEVVRCRDCKHFVTNIHGSYCTKSISTTSDPNGFCHRGERKKDK